MFHFLLLPVTLVLLSASALAGDESTITNGQPPPSYMPPNGVVPNSGVAIGIARSVLGQVYGADNIGREEPLTAQRHGDTWWVQGSICKNCIGGVAEIEIDAKDGRIVGMIHGQ